MPARVEADEPGCGFGEVVPHDDGDGASGGILGVVLAAVAEPSVNAGPAAAR